MIEIPNNEKFYLGRAGLALLIVLSLYFAIKTISEIKNYNFLFLYLFSLPRSYPENQARQFL